MANNDSSIRITLKDFYAEWKQGNSDITKKIDALRVDIQNQYVPLATFNELKKEVEAMKSERTWLIRIVGGAIIMALLGLVMRTGQ